MNESTLKKIENWIKEGRSGKFLTSNYTRDIDLLLRNIFNSVDGGEKTALIALGGYGREELSPFSDIDIMCFAPERSDTGTVERVLYRLWDTGYEISHSCRNAAECVEEAFKDVRTRTSLLEARYIAGNRQFYHYFMENVYPEIAFKKQKDFVRDKLREMEKRHLSYGDSIFLLEPNVKEGEGGLRDAHTAYWLSKIVLRSGDFNEFLSAMGSYERKRFAGAYDFLIRLRFSLHVASRRKNDVLSFEFQKIAADLLGFRDSEKFKAAERMMRYYYLKSRVISETASEIISDCSKLFINVPRDMKVKRLTDDFLISGGTLVTISEDLFEKKPDKILESFYFYSKTGRKFSPMMKEKIRANLRRINKRTRNSQEAVSHFMEILKGDRVYDTLREMQETGVLGRFIPEFGALRLLVVHEPYHMYTVDEHTLIAIRNLEELRRSPYKNREDLHLMMNGMRHLDSLFLALLLHDIGKAAGRRHEEEGYKRLKNVLERFDFGTAERSRIEFLVRNHVLMSKIALKREASDPEVTALLADAVGDIENLQAIYLITYADISAVKPGFWTSWKAYLLRDLYVHTRDYLSGIKVNMADYIRSLQSIYPDLELSGLSRFLEEMPDRYLISTTRNKVLEDYGLVRKMRESGFSMRIDYSRDGIAEVCICAQDSPGLFSKMAGFLSSKGLDIVNGRIFTGKKGIVIDKISISNWKDVWWSGLPEDLEEGLKGIILEGREVVLSTRRVKTESPFDIFIELDNVVSEEFSVIEIFCPDRLGLLYEISDLLHRLGLDIALARINTESGLAQDIFFVREEKKKIGYRKAQDLLSELWTILKGKE